MRFPIPVLALVLALGGSLGAAEPAQPSKAEIRATMERVADWQLAHPYTKTPPTDWINGAFYTGLLALADISDSPRFHDAMMRIGEKNRWELGPHPYDADDQCVGQAYVELYLQHHDPRMIAPMKERFDSILAHPKSNSLDFSPQFARTRKERWSWCDSLFMAPPGWLRLSIATGDARYTEFMIKEWQATTDYLYDRDEHLFFRDSTFFQKREPNGKKIFWARGNGWVIAGLARVLEVLPADHPARPRFEAQFREMAAKIVSLQQADGFWRMSLLDAADYPLPESSGTGFFCFGLAWGINHGLLDHATYQPAVRRAWAALTSCIQSDGKLTHVQTVAGSPNGFPPDGTMPYGVGAFLLAGRELYRAAP